MGPPNLRKFAAAEKSRPRTHVVDVANTHWILEIQNRGANAEVSIERHGNDKIPTNVGRGATVTGMPSGESVPATWSIRWTSTLALRSLATIRN